MTNTVLKKDQVIKYLAWTFVLAYIIQIGSASLYKSNRQAGQLVLAAMMFVPTLGVILSGARLKEMGWKPQIRKNIRTYLIAWFAPLILTLAGGALYFLVFPSNFDLSGEYMAVIGGPGTLEQMKEQGLSYPVYALISMISSITYAPLINMFVALGEEIGWRGFLYPQLKAGFGRRIGWLLGGFIWGAWHWPLIWLIGYEYGAATGNLAGYIGSPITGMLLFSIIAAGLGILHDWLYERSGSIWVPALLHGAFNAAAALPLMVCLANTGSLRLLGPAPTGIISGLPFLIIAAVMLARAEKKREA
ncbi:MAG: CPBP family intramembrane metalloprotease [Lachnospiraceae bacterium]|nr:CPBP family intramembrane metalloprotease [Lachnospiraceae bacterium]